MHLLAERSERLQEWVFVNDLMCQKRERFTNWVACITWQDDKITLDALSG